jgi:hypothetical protein
MNNGNYNLNILIVLHSTISKLNRLNYGLEL